MPTPSTRTGWIATSDELPKQRSHCIAAAVFEDGGKQVRFIRAVEFRPHDDPQWVALHAEDEHRREIDYSLTDLLKATVTHWRYFPAFLEDES